MATCCPPHNSECASAGKSVHQGHVKSNTMIGIDMLDPGALDDAAVVWPHNDNCPLPSTDFRMMPVHGNCHVGLGSSGSTDLHLNLTLSITPCSPVNNNNCVGGCAVGQFQMVGKSVAVAKREKCNALDRRQWKRMRRAQAKMEIYQAQQRSKLATINPYLPKGMHRNSAKQPAIAPMKKPLVKKIGKSNIMEPSNTLLPVTDIDVLASKTRGPGTNLSVGAASDSTAVVNHRERQTKKPQQPCYIWRNIWHKQMSSHISRLQVPVRAPSDGCTIAHVISKRELDEIVVHGATMIHLTQPVQDQDNNNISWSIATPGVLNTDGETSSESRKM